jgi:hypothetical protein
LIVACRVAPFEPCCGKSIQIAFHEQVTKQRACFNQGQSSLIVLFYKANSNDHITQHHETGARQNSSFTLAGTARRGVRASRRDAPASEEFCPAVGRMTSRRFLLETGAGGARMAGATTISLPVKVYET